MYGYYGTTETLIEAELAGHPPGLSPAIEVDTDPATSGVTVAEAAPSPSADLIAWQSWEFGFDTPPPREVSAIENQIQQMRQRKAQSRRAAAAAAAAPVQQSRPFPLVPVLLGGALLLFLAGRNS